MTSGQGDEWWVRYGGRESGPFSLERLRVMAARGALTRLHQVSADRQAWSSAADVQGILAAEDRSVNGTRNEATREQAMHEAMDVAGELEGAMLAESKHGSPRAVPVVGGTTAGALAEAPARATIRMAQGVAIVAAALALAAPTSRWPDGALQWWPQQQPVNVAVHALCAAAVAAWWIALALAPAPAFGAGLAATSALLAAAVALPLREWAPWAMPFALAVPCAAVLVASFGTRAHHRRLIGTATAVIAPLCALAAATLLWRDFSEWGAVSTALGGAGALGLAWAGVRVARESGAVGARGAAPFTATVVASIGLVGALFAAACGGLAGTTPIHGAAGAVAALLTLALSVLAWVGVHQLAAAGKSATPPSHTPFDRS